MIAAAWWEWLVALVGATAGVLIISIGGGVLLGGAISKVFNWDQSPEDKE